MKVTKQTKNEVDIFTIIYNGKRETMTFPKNFVTIQNVKNGLMDYYKNH